MVCRSPLHCARHNRIWQAQVIPITGGTIYGETIRGRWYSRGVNWNVTYQDSIVHVFAEYLLETDSSEFIVIKNEGLMEPVSGTVITTKPICRANALGNVVI